MANRVTLYTRIGNSTPQRANPLIHQPVGKFVLRYLFRGKRRWETLEAMNYTEALVTAKQREIELIKGVDPEWEAQVQRLKELWLTPVKVDILPGSRACCRSAASTTASAETVQAYKLDEAGRQGIPQS